MTKIVHSIEIARSPEEVFAYLDDLSRHGEWQDEIISTKVESEGPTGVGTRATDKRRVPGGARDITYEIVEHDPPRRVSFKGINGPIRVVGTATVEPAGEGRSRVTVELDFEGRGFGKVLAPLVRSQTRKRVPKNHENLKGRLESGA